MEDNNRTATISTFGLVKAHPKWVYEADIPCLEGPCWNVLFMHAFSFVKNSSFNSFKIFDKINSISNHDAALSLSESAQNSKVLITGNNDSVLCIYYEV